MRIHWFAKLLPINLGLQPNKYIYVDSLGLGINPILKTPEYLLSLDTSLYGASRVCCIGEFFLLPLEFTVMALFQKIEGGRY